ncbi:MAG TPA: hypothetical protein VIV66_03305 [Pyrinomonadaceae bacterium]
MSFTADSQHAFAPAPDPENLEVESSADNESVNSEAGNVDKIREILFGGQMRAYDKRFVRLEERFAKETSDLREETKNLFKALEVFVKSEFEALTNRLQTEQRSRDESVQGVSRELHETAKALESKLQQFDAQTTQTHRDLRQQLLDQSQTLSDEIRRKHEEVSALLERELAALDKDKTGRASLSALFSEVALRLNNDFKMPGDK